MKSLAGEMPNPDDFWGAAEEISERADEHEEVAERLEGSDGREADE